MPIKRRLPLSDPTIAKSDVTKKKSLSPRRSSKTVIEDANKLSRSDLFDRYIDGPSNRSFPPPESLGCEYTLRFETAATVQPADLDQCFALIEQTSRHDYEPSSFGWHPRRKRREMAEPEMRYLLLDDKIYDGAARNADTDLDPDTATTPRGAIMGFMSFMLTHDSVPSVPVLYIYEIHLVETYRGKGLGKHFMTLAENIAQRVGLEKVMLTYFLSNEKARGFYERLGYGVDECSPEDRTTRKKVVKVDYVIASKRIERAQAISPEEEDAVPTDDASS